MLVRLIGSIVYRVPVAYYIGLVLGYNVAWIWAALPAVAVPVVARRGQARVWLGAPGPLAPQVPAPAQQEPQALGELLTRAPT